jgi:hypothetical protein
MYNDLDSYEKAIAFFGTRVEIICAMEVSGKLNAETAYKNIKIELKELKKLRKKHKKEM